MKVLVTGGTGFVGEALVKYLLQQGHEVVIASRQEKAPQGRIQTLKNPQQDQLFSTDCIQQIDAVINLAGHSIAGGRWTPKVKELILNSRVQLTRQLVNSIIRNSNEGLSFPKVFINASAIGYYGTHPANTFDEKSPQGKGYLAKVCQEWESEALKAKDYARVICLRLGVVLGLDGGILEQIAKPYRYGLGGYVGSGKQWFSWIHRDDLIEVIAQALKDSRFSSVYNLCSPMPVTIAELNQQLAQVLHRSSWTRLPGFLAKLLFGEMADELLINGQKVLPARLMEQGYSFKYKHIDAALRAVYPPESAGEINKK